MSNNLGLCIEFSPGDGGLTPPVRLTTRAWESNEVFTSGQTSTYSTTTIQGSTKAQKDVQ